MAFSIRSVCHLFFALFTLSVMVPAWAQVSPLDARMKKVLADNAATSASINAAKKVTFFCEVCHGVNGSSVKGDVPNLAGQNSSYLLTQIDKFSRGQRQEKFMEGLMKLLTEEERINVALFYSSKAVEPAGKETSLTGQAIYTARCSMCHAEHAHGNETTPRLAGQQIDYLKKSIKRYRDRTGERIYEPMSASTAGLKEVEIQALAAYLSSLK
ncbi:cytochrome c [Undibacterium sp. KW1]|uniref:c-type cytochrome n=1 Tax=Undibacterium sp. KW1 TaxID=2058624 RepID=UPI001331D4A2|nr:c-type cytochrome [Undibacterium sp. KW1]BBB58685.1 cytochrome c [Undibacterium sp. KW1]